PTIRLPIRAASQRKPYALAAIVILAVPLLVWASLKWEERQYKAWIANPPAAKIRAGEYVISGRELQTGIAVLPDDAEPLKDAPSMGITPFRAFLKAANVDPSQSGDELPPLPFAMIDPHEWVGGAFGIYFVPTEVFRNRSVRRWRVKVVKASRSQNWY